MSIGSDTAALPIDLGTFDTHPLHGNVRRHFGAAGTSPYLDMTDTKATLSGGPPALTTAATSLKYCAPMSGDWTIRARAVSANGFEKA